MNIDLRPLIFLAFVGLFGVFIAAGAAVGALVITPFVLWFHTPNLYVFPILTGAGIGGTLCFAFLFLGGPRG